MINKSVKLVTAGGIIQRDAIISALEVNGLEFEAADRTSSRKITETTVDITYAGYSAVSESGFEIFVDERDFQRAQEILDSILSEFKKQDSKIEVDHRDKFNKCALFTIVLPGVMHVIGVIHLVKAGKSGQLRNLDFKFYVSVVVFMVTLFGGLLVSIPFVRG